jgi:Tfp pilus assembly protein PilN
MMRQVDLLPERYSQRRRERRNIAFVGLAGLLVVVLLIGYWFILGARVTDEENTLAEAQARNATLQAEINKLQVFAELEAEVKAKREALVTVMTGDLNWPAIMTELAMVIPGEVWLTQLTASAGATEGSAPVGTETNPIPLSNKTITGRIDFQGNALSMPGVAKWLIRLGSVKKFDAIWLSSATASEETAELPSVVAFNNTIQLGLKALSQRFVDGDDLP